MIDLWKYILFVGGLVKGERNISCQMIQKELQIDGSFEVDRFRFVDAIFMGT